MTGTPDGAKILIVDDEPVNVLLDRAPARSGAGYQQPGSTTDSRAALGLYREFAPDLILLDLDDAPPGRHRGPRPARARRSPPTPTCRCSCSPPMPRRSAQRTRAGSGRAATSSPSRSSSSRCCCASATCSRRGACTSRWRRRTARSRTRSGSAPSSSCRARRSRRWARCSPGSPTSSTTRWPCSAARPSSCHGPGRRAGHRAARAQDRRCGRALRAHRPQLPGPRPPAAARAHATPALKQVVPGGVELLAYELRTDSVEVMHGPRRRSARCCGPIRHQLHQVFVNLVANAHHAMRRRPRPEAHHRAWARPTPRPGAVRLDVADTGPGIPRRVQARDLRAVLHDQAARRGHRARACRSAAASSRSTAAPSTVESGRGRGRRSVIDLPVATPPPVVAEAAAAARAPAPRDARQDPDRGRRGRPRRGRRRGARADGHSSRDRRQRRRSRSRCCDRRVVRR